LSECTTIPRIFISADEANKVIQRSKRANFLIFDEILQGNLEKECHEEICSYEEAKEVFENKEKTDEFWSTYYGGRQCTSNPCQNKGECQDTIRSYVCDCPTGYHGSKCEFANNECYATMNEGCQHFCNPNYGHDLYFCSCANGYTLGEDEKSCQPAGKLKRARGGEITSITKNTALLNSDREMFCSGVILSQTFVLTTAKCSKMYNKIFVYAVADHRVHLRYDEKTGDNDLAVLKLQENILYNNHTLPICIPQKDFSDNVLLPSKSGILSTWKQSPSQDPLDWSPYKIPVINREKEICESTLNKTQTNRMYCVASPAIFDSNAADGGYSAVKHKGTWFLTGIMRGLNPAISPQNIFSLTKISRYIMWLNEV
uniref:Protein Z, vitamin K dependent plasma glycoprotein n=1 Tax=Leptobrachium leishanense TaxID=445787 RepID=A0A8C5P9K8_9ANUR